MADQKFDPVKEFINLRDSIGKAVEKGIKNVAGVSATFPAVDVYETSDLVILRTEPLIGLSAASIEVSMEADILTISGETKNDLDISDSAYLSRELQFGRFTRSVRITRKVKANEASASLKQGILTVTLPKAADGKTQIIDVTPAE